jgi:hypothetical protein
VWQVYWDHTEKIINMKHLAACTVALAIAASTFATSNDSPWALRLGPIFPRLGNTAGLTVNVGASFSVAYRAYRNETFSLEVESLGSSYSVSDGAGDSATFTVSNLNLVALVNAKDSKFYYGGSIGSAKPNASLQGVVFEGETSSVYGPVIGTKLSGGWFIEARYMFCSVPASRGTMILGGYRF